MKVCLISPPTVTDFNERLVARSEAHRLIAQHAPMGILSLSAVLGQHGIEPEIFDLNQLYYRYISSDERQHGVEFCAYANRALETVTADVFGFSTICSSYPLTLRLARGVRITHPDAWIILGGPQASVVDVATLNTFPAVDLIVRGEAERSFPAVLDAISNNARSFEQINGVTFRQGENVIRNQIAPVIEDLDALPLPAFPLYYTNDCTYAPIEAGRGCPFACSFCSTNDFFRRRFRLKSPRVLVSQMAWIKRTYGIESFDLIHDMFTVDRKKVIAFCDAVEESGEELYWSCSARTDCVDDELIARMAHAGCDGIFFGIDAGSERMQEIIQKGLDMNEAAARVKCTNRHGIRTTVSLITGFPEETKDDLRATINFLGDSLRYQNIEIQLHLLAPLAETPITSQYRDELVYDDILSDISFQGWEQNPEEREMIKAHRDIFPNFYAVPCPLNREYLRELREFLVHTRLRHLWLLVLLHRDSNDLVAVFDEWQTWSIAEGSIGGVLDRSRAYYASDAFSHDLLRFVETHYAKVRASAPHLLRTMAEVERIQLTFSEDKTDDKRAPKPRRQRLIESMECVPAVVPDVRLALVSADYKRLIQCLKRNARIDLIKEEEVSLVFVREKDEIKVVQLTPATYELITLCDGSRNVQEISDRLSTDEELGISPQKASVFGLATLAQKGLIEVRTVASL